MKQETLSLNRGSTFLKGKNEQFITRRIASRTQSIWPQVTSQQPLLLTYAFMGRGLGGEGCRRRPNYEWTKAEKRPNETKEKCRGWQTELSDSFPWQDDKTVWNARMERGKRSDQELSNEERGEKVDDRRGEHSWLKNSGRPSLHLFISPLLTNSVPFLPCSCATTNCTPTLHFSSGESSLLVGWRNSTNVAVCNAARPWNLKKEAVCVIYINMYEKRDQWRKKEIYKQMQYM